MLNITTYLMDEEAHLLALDKLATSPCTHMARDLTDLELSHWGFAPAIPWSANTHDLHFDVIHTERVLSSEVARLKVAEAQRKVEQAGEALTRERAKAIKEAVTNKLIGEAPQRRSTVHVRLDPTLGMVQIGTAKASDAEAVLKLLRIELGSFPALPMGTMAMLAPQIHLTDALRVDGYLPANRLWLGHRIALELPGEKAKARFTDMEADSEAVHECLREGLRVARLGLVADGMVEFEVDKELVLRRFELGDLDEDRMDDEIDRWGETAKAMQVIQYGEASKVLVELARWMDIRQPLAERQEAA